MVCIGNFQNRNNVQHISDAKCLLLSSTFGSASPFRLHPHLFRCPVSDLMCSCCRIFTYWSENGCVDNYKLGYYEMHIFHWPQLKINHFLNGIYIDKRERRASIHSGSGFSTFAYHRLVLCGTPWTWFECQADTQRIYILKRQASSSNWMWSRVVASVLVVCRKLNKQIDGVKRW